MKFGPFCRILTFMRFFGERQGSTSNEVKYSNFGTTGPDYTNLLDRILPSE